MKLVAEYLEQSVRFELMASEATDPKLAESLREQARAYRRLAEKRAAEINLPPVNLPELISTKDRRSP